TFARLAAARPQPGTPLGLPAGPGARLPRRLAGRLRRRPLRPPVPRLRPPGTVVDQPAVRAVRSRPEATSVAGRQSGRMNAESWPWLGLSVVVPLLGVPWVALRRKDPEVAARRCLAVTAVTLLCAIAAWLTFSLGHWTPAPLPWGLPHLLVIDELSAPL